MATAAAYALALQALLSSFVAPQAVFHSGSPLTFSVCSQTDPGAGPDLPPQPQCPHCMLHCPMAGGMPALAAARAAWPSAHAAQVGARHPSWTAVVMHAARHPQIPRAPPVA